MEFITNNVIVIILIISFITLVSSAFITNIRYSNNVPANDPKTIAILVSIY